MFEYLKYLQLLELVHKHPALVALVRQLITEVQPHMSEIEQAVAEAQVIINKIYATPRAAVVPPVEFYSPKPKRKRRSKRK